MKIKANTVTDYLENIPEERKPVFIKLREVIVNNLPKGFHEEMNYGMIGYVVPHSLYEKGYHCNPDLPLPFLNIACQKNFIGLYHMGIYADESLLKWFKEEFPKHTDQKLDMGKSCIRFKNNKEIPFELVASLVAKVSPAQWIEQYEKSYVK